MNLKTELKNALNLRYAMFDRIADGSANPIIDSYMPKAIKDNVQNLNLPHSAYCVSEWFSNMTGVRQLPFKMMLQTLNVSDKELKEMVLKVKRKKLHLCFVGFGGTGTNTYHWLTKILDHTGNVNLFDQVTIYDKETLDFTNLLRIPFDTDKLCANYKVDLFDNRNNLSNRTPKVEKRYITPIKRNWASSSRLEPEQRLYKSVITSEEDAHHKTYVPHDNVVFYGAPNLETRADMNEANFNFINATHGNDDCSLMLKPEIDMNLQTESYGMIRLTSFFFNQLAMTIALLRFLADDDEDKWNKEGEFFKFNFKDFINDNKHGKADKILTFQVNHAGTIELD